MKKQEAHDFSRGSITIPCQFAAFDLDGTLLNNDHKLSPENREALQQLAANEVLVVLVSGRMHRSIQSN